MSKSTIRKVAETIATALGTALGTSYELRDGSWWLLAAGVPQRPLTADEVAWHTARRHAPFVADGIHPGDPAWWEDPEEESEVSDE